MLGYIHTEEIAREAPLPQPDGPVLYSYEVAAQNIASLQMVGRSGGRNVKDSMPEMLHVIASRQEETGLKRFQFLLCLL